MKHECGLSSGLVISGMVILLFLVGCGGGTASIGGGGTPVPVPTITAISPTSAVAGSAAGFTLTVNGTNFVSASVVNFAGTARTTTFVASTQLTVAIPAAAIASAGTAPVTVANPAPGGGTSNPVNFDISSGTNPVPMISSLDPSCAPVGARAFTLAVVGTNFVPSSVVRWNGKDLSTTVNGGPLAQIPASDIAATGMATVTVFNPSPGGGVSNSVTFNIAAGGVSPTSVAVDPGGKFAYVANDGCPDAFAGSVSMYTIDLSSGLLTSIGPPVTTGDFGADSVAVDPSGNFAYVANSGEGNTAGSVSMYTINPTNGALTLAGTIVAPCAPPPSPGSCAPWSLAVHPSGKFAYVANEGGFTPTSISMYAIDATTGGLTLIGTVAADGRAVSVTVDPTGKFAYVADGGDTSDGSRGINISMYNIDATTGVLTSIGKIAAGLSPTSIAIHPTGKFFYAANLESNDISMYTINTTTGNLTSTGTLAAGVDSIAIHPSGKFAYGTTSSGVSMYTIDATTGALTLAGITGAGSSPRSITIHPSGKFAYGTNAASNSVSMYSIDPATGSLTIIGTVST